MEAVKIDKNEFALMHNYLEKNCGIFIPEEKTYLFETRLTALMVEQNCATFSQLYVLAIADKTCVLRDKIVEAMTTNETLWFRDQSPFHTLEEVIFKQYMDEVAQGKRSGIRIWCMAGSTGQEPYSIAMTLLEFARRHALPLPHPVEILATDVSSAVLYIAKRGRYDELSITRGLSPELRDRYFVHNGKFWDIHDQVKKMVTFKKFNLQDSYSLFGKLDTIFCRNVLIYFADPFKKDILQRVAALLRPGGYLFLGASESLLNYSAEFDMLSHRRGLYYRVK